MQMQIQKRNIIVAVLLSIVTCGIYSIVWVIKMMKEAVQVKDPNDSATAEILLGIFLPFLGFYLAEKKFTEGAQARGIPHKDNSVIYIILGLLGFGIVNFILMQKDLNDLVDNGYAYDPSNNAAQQGQPVYQQPPVQPMYQQPPVQPQGQPAYQQPPVQPQGPQPPEQPNGQTA